MNGDNRDGLSGILELNREYYIQELIGGGGNCLVYKALSFEGIEGDDGNRVGRHFHIVKELFPLDLAMDGIIVRNGQRLEFADTATTKAKERFENRKQLFSDKQEIEELLQEKAPNRVPKIELYCGPANGTVYSVTQGISGKTLDEEVFGAESQLKTLSDIVDIAIDIARVLQIYHDLGLVHLDLNSSNIIKMVDEKRVMLIDFDSIRKEGDLAGDKGKVLFYSPEWSAPELLYPEEGVKITRKADIYSLGLIFLFLLLKCDNPAQEVREMMLSRDGWARIDKSVFLRDTGSECKSQIKKTLKIALMACPENRYQKIEDMLGDLCRIKDQAAKTEAFSERMMVYNLLYSKPLYDYIARSREKPKKKEINALLIGSDSVIENAFKAIFWCGQIATARLRIFSLSKTGEDFKARLEASMPFLAKYDLADLREENFRKVPDLCDVGEALREFGDITYCLISTGDDRLNAKLAQQAKEQYDGNPLFVSGIWEKRFRTELTADQINAFSKRLEEDGFNIHFSYVLGSNPYAGRRKTRNEYDANEYNKASSTASALHINYKLKSYGIDPSDSQKAWRGIQGILDGKANGESDAKKAFRGLVHLEHRRWVAYMITEGCACPSGDELKRYAFNVDDHRVKGFKMFMGSDKRAVIYHPCLVESAPNANLLNLSHSYWDKQSEESIRGNDKLDDLDKASLCLHLIACEKSNAADKDIREQMKKLEQSDKHIAVDHKALNHALDMLLRGEPASEENWKRACNDSLRKMIPLAEDREKASAIQEGRAAGEIEDLVPVEDRSLYFHLKRIDGLLEVVKERNRYQDYKAFDAGAIEIMPFVLSRRKPLSIVKLYAKQMHDNIASSLLYMPSRLFVVGNSEDAKAIERIQSFFKGRGGNTIVEQRAAQSKGGLYDIETIANIINDVGADILDITGYPDKSDGAFLKMKNAHTALTVLKNNKVEKGEEKYSKIGNAKISVAETLYLLGEEKTKPSYRKDPQGIGDSFQSVEGFFLGNMADFGIFIEALRNIFRLDNVFCYENRKPAKLQACVFGSGGGAIGRSQGIQIETWFPRAYADRVGLIDLLEHLDIEKVITAFRYGFDRAKDVYEISFVSEANTGVEDLLEELEKKNCQDRLVFNPLSKEVVVSPLHADRVTPDALSKNVRRQWKTVLEMFEKAEGAGLLALVREKGDNGNDTVNIRFGDAGIFDLLHGTAESILERIVYRETLSSGIFDDIQSNAVIGENMGPKAEMDIIASKNLTTVFISCKLGKVKAEELGKIKRRSDSFGFLGIPVLVCASDIPAKKMELAEALKVEIIDRQDILGKKIGERIAAIYSARTNNP